MKAIILGGLAALGLGLFAATPARADGIYFSYRPHRRHHVVVVPPAPVVVEPDPYYYAPAPVPAPYYYAPDYYAPDYYYDSGPSIGLGFSFGGHDHDRGHYRGGDRSRGGDRFRGGRSGGHRR